jgi:hypothetical protein
MNTGTSVCWLLGTVRDVARAVGATDLCVGREDGAAAAGLPLVPHELLLLIEISTIPAPLIKLMSVGWHSVLVAGRCRIYRRYTFPL